MKHQKLLAAAAALALLCGCGSAAPDAAETPAPTAHDAVKNSPAEYYTGAEPETDAAAYIAHDVYYYPELDTSGFQKQRYDGETEWVYYYTAEGYTDYVFSTLPVQGSAVPEQMMHSESEAYENAVLHLTEPGTYVISGTWHGQIWIDLGDTDATFADPDAKVTLILNGAKIDCTVAPGVVFYSVYECDNAWETRESYGAAAGTGAAQKKARKTDGAFYSYVSMNVTGGAEGSGVLNITSTFEGLDTELHLTVNGGSLHILAGLGSEGDSIDSNGYVVINGGTVVALGASMDWAESDGSKNAGQAAVNLSFSQRQSADEAIVITDTDGKAVFAYDPDKDEVAESNASWYSDAILSVPGLSVGGEYYIYVGGDVEGEEVTCVYDPDSVTGFTADAKQQCWTGTGTLGGFGGGPGGFGGGGGGFDPSGGNGGFDPNGGDAAGEGEVVFSLSEKVNGFTGVRDAE